MHKAKGRVTVGSGSSAKPLKKAKVHVLEGILSERILESGTTNENGNYEISYRKDAPLITIRAELNFLGVPLLYESFPPVVQKNENTINLEIGPGKIPVDLNLTHLYDALIKSLTYLVNDLAGLQEELKSLVDGLIAYINQKIRELISNAESVSPSQIAEDIRNEGKKHENEIKRLAGEGGRQLYNETVNTLAGIVEMFGNLLSELAGTVLPWLVDRPDVEYRIKTSAPYRQVIGYPQTSCETFNHTILKKNSDGYLRGFNSEGLKCFVTLEDGEARVRFGPMPRGRYLSLIEGGNNNMSGHDGYSLDKVVSYTHNRRGTIGRLPANFKFDMVTANGNRLFAKEKDTDRFFFATLYEEFPLQDKHGGGHVPGCYLKLDPQDNLLAPRDKDLEWWTDGEGGQGNNEFDHPAMAGYAFMPIAKFGLEFFLQDLEDDIREQLKTVGIDIPFVFLRHFRFLPDIMMVKVVPGVWHEIDSRPPYGSGRVPLGLPTYDHITYQATGVSGLRPEVLLPGLFRWLLGTEENVQSIDFDKVLSIGVANTHRHMQYDDSCGMELSSGPDHYLVGPVLDRGGFWDGTCNFYALVHLKKRSPHPDRTDNRLDKYDYGVLWLDEQSYFSERWRLLSPFDSLWGRLREWSMVGSLKRTLTLEPLRNRAEGFGRIQDTFWCPFENGLIDDNSRMVVSRFVILVTGKKPESGRPMELYSIAFNWGGMDRTWRYRTLPDYTIIYDDLPGPIPRVGNTIRPQKIVLRDDLTICVPGSKRLVNRRERPIIYGWHYQTYLPASKKEPAAGRDTPVKTKFSHPWKFMTNECFEHANASFHFGDYAAKTKPYDNRSQFYPLDCSSHKNPEDWSEEIVWSPADKEALFTFQPSLLHVTKDLEKLLKELPIDPTELICQCPPSLFNDKVMFRIRHCHILGLIAMYWDKRDDDLYPLWFDLNDTKKSVKLIAWQFTDGKLTPVSGEGPRTVDLYRQKRKWCPPIVQKATFTFDQTSTQSATIRLESKMIEKPRSLKEPWLDEVKEFKENQSATSFIRRVMGNVDNDPYDFAYARYQDALGKSAYSSETPPDLTLRYLRVGAIEDGKTHVKEWPISSFRWAKPNIFEIDWKFNDDSDFMRYRNWFTSEGLDEHGTTVILEDIVGHRATVNEISLNP